MTIQIQSGPDFLQPQGQATTAYTLTAERPSVALNFAFSLDTLSYSYTFPIPSVQVPGTIEINVPLSSILANIINDLSLGIPIGSLTTLLVKLNLPISFSSVIEGQIIESGLTETNGLLVFTSSTTESYNSTLTGLANDASITLQNLAAIFSLQASLDLSILFSTHHLASAQLPLAMFNSTSNIRAADYYQVQIQSPYGQTSGSGWYLSGTTATISIPSSQTVSSGTTYDFTGWTGTGPGSYAGTLTSYSLIVTGPVTETANWTQHQFSSPLTGSMIEYAILGIVLIATIVIIVTVLVLRTTRRTN